MVISLLWERERHGFIDATDLHMKGVKAKPFKDRLGAKPGMLQHLVTLEVKDSLNLKWKRKVESLLRMNPHWFRKDVRARVMVDCKDATKKVTLNEILEDDTISQGVYISARDPKEFSNRLCNIIIAQRKKAGHNIDHHNTENVKQTLEAAGKLLKKRVGKKRKPKKASSKP